MKGAAKNLFHVAAPAIAATFRPDEVREAARAAVMESQQRFDELSERLAADREKANAISNEVSQTLEAAKTAAEDAGLAAQSVYFENQATEHLAAGRGWLIGSVVLLIAIVAASLWSIEYYMRTPPQPDTPANLQLLLAKAILFSALFGALVAATRSYRAHRHNYVVNRHRHNALLTFRAFSQQANADPTTKNAVLLQATQCIFSPQSSGYSGSDSDTGGYPQILEIVRGIAVPDKKT